MRLFLILCFSVILVTDGFSQASWHYSLGFIVTNKEGVEISSKDLYDGTVRIYSTQESPALEYINGLRLFNVYGVTHIGRLKIGCINGQDTTIISLSQLSERRLIITSWPRNTGFYEVGTSSNQYATYSSSVSTEGHNDLHTLSILDWNKFKVPQGPRKMKELIARMRLESLKSK